MHWQCSTVRVCVFGTCTSTCAGPNCSPQPHWIGVDPTQVPGRKHGTGGALQGRAGLDRAGHVRSGQRSVTRGRCMFQLSLLFLFQFQLHLQYKTPSYWSLFTVAKRQYCFVTVVTATSTAAAHSNPGTGGATSHCFTSVLVLLSLGLPNCPFQPLTASSIPKHLNSFALAPTFTLPLSLSNYFHTFTLTPTHTHSHIRSFPCQSSHPHHSLHLYIRYPRENITSTVTTIAIILHHCHSTCQSKKLNQPLRPASESDAILYLVPSDLSTQDYYILFLRLPQFQLKISST